MLGIKKNCVKTIRYPYTVLYNILYGLYLSIGPVIHFNRVDGLLAGYLPVINAWLRLYMEGLVWFPHWAGKAVTTLSTAPHLSDLAGQHSVPTPWHYGYQAYALC